MIFAGTKNGIYKTIDEGQSFTRIAEVKDIASITFDTLNPTTVYAATANGALYKSEDEGKKWSKVKES